MSRRRRKDDNHFIRNQFRILFKVSHHARLDELFRLGCRTAELFETGMDLIPYLDPQLLKALVLVLQELQRLLALILHEDEFCAGDVEEPDNAEFASRMSFF